METDYVVKKDAPHEAYAKTNPEVLKSCVMCENPGNLACAVCGTKYCSQACQKQDWKYHKILCKASVGTEFRLDNRPGPDYRRIIEFPVDQKKPGWVWARFQGGRRGLADSESKRLLKRPSDKFLSLHIPLNASCSNPYMRFGRGLHLFTLGEKFEGRPSMTCRLPINQSILNLAKPGHAQPHFGPYVVGAFSSDEIGRPMVDRGIVWEDATLKDFRLVVDARISSKANACVIDPDRYSLKIRNLEARVWPALKLNCDGDMQRFGLTDAIEIVSVSSVMHAGLRNMQKGDGSYVGTILLMQKQGRAIQRAHLQAVMAYKNLVWAEGIEGLDTGSLPRIPNIDYLNRTMTREKFEAYWYEKWSGSGVPSPYTLED
ncbi:MYND-type domain-containing protein [Apiospora saccharicola]